MPEKFGSKRIYELPVLKHNIAAVSVIYKNAMLQELSPEFLQKAIEHNTMLTKMIILDNIPVGCIYSHVAVADRGDQKGKKCLIVDFVCVLKSYQRRGIGQFTLNKLLERTKGALGLSYSEVFVPAESEVQPFFNQLGYEEKEKCTYQFDGKEYDSVRMVKEL